MHVPVMFTTPHPSTFDWARAIERNSLALKAIVATLFAMLGRGGQDVLIRRILGPAESAVRRLIVIAARGLVVKPVALRPMPKLPVAKGRSAHAAFRLFDPVHTFASCFREAGPAILPRIHVFGADPRVAALWAARPAPAPASDKPPRLIVRLHAIKSALDDLQRQARRLARWRMKRQNDPGFKFKSPLRPGPPPGHRRRKTHEIDDILTECHGLARDALRVDTS
jgi:hypothetical protein